MTMKTLLLGAAAGLVTVGAAQAADLPMTKAEAVEYVKVCTEFGAGFFYIPGTDTCLKIGGQIRADYTFGGFNGNLTNSRVRTNDVVNFGGRAQVTWDARTDTGYGLLRSFIALNGNITDGASSFSVDKAYIQLGGLTAGYATSFFDFYASDNTIFAGEFDSDHTTNLLAYSAQFGGGFIATLSVEDAKVYRAGNTFIGTPGVVAPATAADTNVVGGVTAPDVVGSLRITQGWGSAQIMGAVHQVRFGTVSESIDPDGAGPLNPTVVGPISTNETKYGYAVGAGAKFNLPVLGGAVWAIQGTYAKGATAYTGATTNGLGGTDGYVFTGAPLAVGSTFTYKLASAWSVASELSMTFSPSLSGAIYGSYIDYNAPTAAGKASDFKAWQLGGQLTYTIVKDLTVAGEINYLSVDPGGPGGKNDGFFGGVRFQRNF